jgi:hypothetical protein
MSLLDRGSLRLLIYLSAALLNDRAFAELSYLAGQANPPTLLFSLKSEEVAAGAGLRQVQHLFLTCGTNQFACVVPTGFRVDASNPQKVVLVDPDYAHFITIRLIGPVPAGAHELRADYCRTLAFSRFPGAKITQESSETVGYLTGPAFDLEWKNAAGTEQSARLVFVVTPVGIMEFSLLACSNKFSDGGILFNTLLSSFRGSAGGKLDLPSTPDKS